VKLACCGLLRAVRDAIDHQAAHAADAFSAVAVEGDGILALESQPLVQHIQHLQERHVLGDVVDLVNGHLAFGTRARLAPDPKSHIHFSCSCRLAPARRHKSVSSSLARRKACLLARSSGHSRRSVIRGSPAIAVLTCSSAVSSRRIHRPAAPCARSVACSRRRIPRPRRRRIRHHPATPRRLGFGSRPGSGRHRTHA
jgi:hypothetical protein